MSNCVYILDVVIIESEQKTLTVLKPTPLKTPLKTPQKATQLKTQPKSRKRLFNDDEDALSGKNLKWNRFLIFVYDDLMCVNLIS